MPAAASLFAGRIDKEAQVFAPLEMPEPESPEGDEDDIVIVDDDALN